MIDRDRIHELEREIGADDVAAVMSLFLDEANATIARLAGGLDDTDHARAIHFLRSGALNIGLTGFAEEAATAAGVQAVNRPSSAALLRAALDRTQAVLPGRAQPG